MKKIAYSSVVIFLMATASQAFGAWGTLIPDVQISNNANSEYFSSLAWTGTGYGVSWCDKRDGNREIYFARLNGTGSMIGANVRITNDPSYSTGPSLVWAGTEYGVVWMEGRDGNEEIYFARIDAYGNKIGDDVRITNEPASSMKPSLVWTGTEYGVSWWESYGRQGIYFARLDSTGTKIGEDVLISNDAYYESSSYPSLVWTGVEYGVSWQKEDYMEGYTQIYFARIDATGAKIGDDVKITSDSTITIKRYASLAWTGTQYGVSWVASQDIFFARIDSTGAKIGSDLRITNDAAYSDYPSLEWGGSEYGLSWADNRDGNVEIYFARINAAGTRIDSDIRITNAADVSGFPSLAGTSTKYGVSWHDQRTGTSEIFFVQIGDPDAQIPSVSEWGMIVMATLLFIAIAWHIRKRRCIFG